MSEPIPAPVDQSLEGQILQLCRHLTAGTARLLDLLAEFSLSRRWEAYGAKSCAAWLSDRCGFSPAAARERVRVANALLYLPQLRGAFQRGEISYSKCRVVTRHATPESEEEYLTLALSLTAAQLERKLAKPREPRDGQRDEAADGVVSWRVLRNGKIKVEAVLTQDQFDTFAAGLVSAHEGMATPVDQDEPPTDEEVQPAPRADEAGTCIPAAAAEVVPVLWFAGERAGRAGTELLVAMARSQLRAAAGQPGDGRDPGGSATAAGAGGSADVAA